MKIFKKLTTIIITLLFFCAAHASRFLITQERFNDLTETEKEEYIIKVMEFVVELESRYEHALKTEGHDSPITKKYSQVLNQFHSILFPVAWAASKVQSFPDLSVFANDFAQNVNPSTGKNRERCIYAGWISLLDELSKKCIHPARIPRSTPEYKSYAKQSSCPRPVPGDSSKDMIACNPAIFGFMNTKHKTQFCVAGGIEKSFNSSHMCMKLSLGLNISTAEEKKYTMPSKDPSKPEERLAQLKEQFASNPQLATNIANFTLKTCICDPDEGSIISKKYLNEIRPHRTCYGIINLVANTFSCENSPSVPNLNYDLLKEIKSIYNKISDGKNNSYDSSYSKELDKFKDSYSRDYNKICFNKEPEIPIIPATPIIKCNATCSEKVSGESKAIKCSYTVTKDDAILKEDEFEKKEMTQISEGTEIIVKGTNESIKCPITKALEVGPEVTPPITEEAQITCSIKLAESTDKETVIDATLEYEAKNSETLKSVKWSTEESTESSIKFKKEMSPLSAQAVFVKDSKEHTVDCGEVAFPEKQEEDAKPKLLVSGKDNKKDVEIEGKIEGNKEGWTIQWHRQGGNTPKAPKESTAGAKSTALAGDSDTEIKDKAEDKKTETKKTEEESISLDMDKKEKISVPKEEKEYKVCGKLTKKDHDDISGDKCISIPAKKDEAPQAPFHPMQQMGPQMPPRGSGNTSAQGIR